MAKVTSAIQTLNTVIMKASYGPTSGDLPVGKLTPEVRTAIAEWVDKEIISGLIVALRQLGHKFLSGRCVVCQNVFPLNANKVVMHKENPNALEPCGGAGFSPSQVVT